MAMVKVMRTEECLHSEWTMEPVEKWDPWMSKRIPRRSFQLGNWSDDVEEAGHSTRDSSYS